MVQCKIFTAMHPEPEINNFLFDNPQYRYIDHSHHSVIHQGQAWVSVVLFYETSSAHVMRTGPHSAKITGHE